jgi:N-acetyl-gamma-glutamyl-phosphate reductase
LRRRIEENAEFAQRGALLREPVGRSLTGSQAILFDASARRGGDARIMKVGIIGASGYSGELLVKLLLAHPHVTLAAVTSRTHAGKPLAQVIPALRGADRGLKSSPPPTPVRSRRATWTCFFLALPHGAAAEFARVLVPAGKKVIDLSADFRIADLATYERYYGPHHAPELLPSARFVLPELTPPAWRTEAKLVAAPGCYPTSVLVPLQPLLAAGRGEPRRTSWPIPSAA